jgi:sugar phosphate isomerase/epimerase
MFKYGAELVPYHDYGFEESVGALADMGFRHINLWSSEGPLAHHVNPGDDVSEIRRVLSKYKVTPSGLSVYGKTQDEILERVEFASDLGIDTVIFDCETDYPDFVSRFLPPIIEAAAARGVRIAVENHLTVPFSSNFESGANEENRWSSGVDNLSQIKNLILDIDHPSLGVCVAPPHLWVEQESITDVITFLAERKRLFYYYIWDIDRSYARGVDGLNFGPGDQQLPREDGTLNHALLLGALRRVGYEGIASLKCHGTAGWSFEKINNQMAKSDAYVRSSMAHAAVIWDGER